MADKELSEIESKFRAMRLNSDSAVSILKDVSKFCKYKKDPNFLSIKQWVDQAIALLSRSQSDPD